MQAASTARQHYDLGHVDVSESLWSRGAPALDLPRLEGECRADVAVIGAGLAGSSLALHLAEQGVHVALVEAHEPGWGASGRNAGQAVPVRDTDKALAALPDGGEAYLALFRESASLPYDLGAKHDIEFGQRQGGYLQLAHKRELVAFAEKKARKWADRGFGVRYADAAEVARLTGSESFHCGVLVRDGGRMNPYRFTRGLIVAALRAGAVAFARSPVESVVAEGGGFRASTPTGSILAERVVACTNGYTGSYRAELEKAWCPLTAFAIASKPLPPEVVRSVLPEGIAICQMPEGIHPTVIDEDGRVVTSLLPSPRRPEAPGPPLAWMQRWMHAHFPQTQGIELELDAYWTGRMAYSVDELPRIYEVAPGFLALMCFSGEGNVPAPMLGKHLAECLAAGRLQDLALPLTRPEPLRFRNRYHLGLRRIGVPALLMAERLGLY